jgi:TRAP transporter TAXI family solute receptor
MLSLLRVTRVGLLLLSAGAYLLLAPPILPAFQQPALPISSGNVTGGDDVASSAIAKILNRTSTDCVMRLAPVPSEGSVASIASVLLRRTAFGIAKSDMRQRAGNGLSPWQGKPQNSLQAILGLHVEAVTIVAASDREVDRLRDLEGERLNIGAPGSSAHQNATQLLEASGVLPANLTFCERSPVLAPEPLQSGEIEAYRYTAGHLNLSLLEASTGSRIVRLAPLERSLIEQVPSTNPLPLPALISTEDCPGLEHQGEVPTVGVRAVSFARTAAAEESVYRPVRTVLTNIDPLRRQHPRLQSLPPHVACDITVILYHAGAERYFREAGLTDDGSV